MAAEGVRRVHYDRRIYLPMRNTVVVCCHAAVRVRGQDLLFRDSRGFKTCPSPRSRGAYANNYCSANTRQPTNVSGANTAVEFVHPRSTRQEKQFPPYRPAEHYQKREGSAVSSVTRYVVHCTKVTSLLLSLNVPHPHYAIPIRRHFRRRS